MCIDFKAFVLIILFGTMVWTGHAQDMAKANQLLESSQYLEAHQMYAELADQFWENKQWNSYAVSRLKISTCELALGHIDVSIQEAERILEFAHGYLQDTSELVGQTRLLMGSALLHVGRNDLALEQLLLAEPNISDATLDKAECYESMAIAYWNNGNDDLALQYHERAFGMRKQLGAPDGLLGDSNNNIGLVYIKDEPRQSMIYLNRALRYYQSDVDQNRQKIGVCYINLAFAEVGLGNYQDALHYLDRLDSMWTKLYAGDHPNKAFALSSRGRILKLKGAYDEALTYQEEALAMYKSLHGEKHPDVANTYFLIGQLYQERKDYQQAASYYQQSIYANLYDQQYEDLYDVPEVKNYYHAEILLSSLQSKAQALEALHFEKSLKLRDINGALDSYLRCDELIGKIRQQRINEQDKLRLAAIAADVYENGISVSKYLSERTFQRKHYLDIAFDFMERSKAAVLLEAITETKAKHFAGISDEDLATEDSLKTEIDMLEQMMLQDISDVQRSEFQNQLFTYESALRDFVSLLEEKHPEYFKLKYDTHLATLSELQVSLAEGEGVLSYFTAKDKIYIFLVTHRKSILTEVEIGQNWSGKVIGMRNAIKYQMQEEFMDISQQMYETLIPSGIDPLHTLTILPDGVLSTIPFESLVKSDRDGNRYLIEQAAVNYDYSATLYLSNISSQPTAANRQVLLIAPVDFDRLDGMSDLPATMDEVNEIKYLFGGNDVEVNMAVRADASKEVLVGDLSSYHYLHFATHGVVNESNPDQSRIYMHSTASSDGRLYCSEIYNLKLNAGLVSLSACETGLGKISKGEGVIGLSRALKYAGAKNLMVSLWQVNDQSTSDMMISFYQNHLYHSDQEGYSDDLRKAKLKMIGSDDFSAPYYWAPFVLVGR
ncbi:CHAT domain-containing protein [Reichenbachiella agariperforans]|uniref:CHAT domain-containing protein n=1 Tax=Reichenbachiella agariperforans TaxID=156994 RepID=A0A1M6SK59_REIAG|nr:CHAT domain-containing protein [Reichenbachiella agariperforans]